MSDVILAAIAQLRADIAAVHELVNNAHDVVLNETRALKREIARLNRDPRTPTPNIEAGQGEPGEVGINHGVVTAERKGPFNPPDHKDHEDKGGTQ